MSGKATSGPYCEICKRSKHHRPDCPEMFFKNRDGTPDRSKPRGVIVPGSVKPPGPLRGPE